MCPAAEVLVIILAVFLAIFLILGIILLIYLLILTHKIRKISKSAEDAVNGFRTFMSNIAKVISPVFISELISNMVDKMKSNKKETKDNDKK